MSLLTGLSAASSSDPTTWVLLLSVVLFFVGVVFIVLPVLPGLLICVLSVALWAIEAGGVRSWVTLGVVVAIYLTGVALQLLIPGRRMRREGVGTLTLVAAVVAAIVGFFVVPVIGAPLFFVLGIYLVEFARYREAGRAWAATKSALRGVLHSMGIELATAMIIAIVWTGGILSHSI